MAPATGRSQSAGRLGGGGGPGRPPPRLASAAGLEDAGLDPAEEQAEGAPALAHVHGFHAAARPPCVFLAETRAAFAAGKLVVTQDLDSGRQEFVRGHSAAITCLAHSPEQSLGASGQARRPGARFAEVLLWSSREGERQVCTVFAFHQADVEAVGFVQGGEILVSISADRDHTMALWASARDGWFGFQRKDGPRAPLAVCSAYKSGGVAGVLGAPGGAARFVTFGQTHIKFWTCDRLTLAVDGRRGAFGKGGTPRAIVAAAWAGQDRLVAGSAEGEVFFFQGTQALRRVSLQRCRVALLLPLKDTLLAVYANGVCSLLLSDRAVNLDIAGVDGAPEARVQSHLVGGAAWRQGRLLLASRTHLLLLDLAEGCRRVRACKTLVVQPSAPLTSVCAIPGSSQLFTGALDGGVRCYRTDVHSAVPERSFKTSSGVTCLAVSAGPPAGTGASAWLAVGCEDSALSVLGEASFHYVFRRYLSANKVKLTCARFSPCDASGGCPLWLAVGTESGTIHTFRFKDSVHTSAAHSGSEAISKVSVLRGHAAPIVDIQFADTLPCERLISVDSSGQSIAFDVPMAHRLQSLTLVRDLPFSPWTAPVGWHVAGCQPPQRPAGAPELPPRRLHEVLGRGLVAASETSGPSVELYPFPCPTAPRAPPPRLLGPASPVAALACGDDGDCLLAASDTVLFVWAWPRPEPADARGASPVPVAWAEAGADGTPPRRWAQSAGSVLLETPEGKKRAMPADAAANVALLTPPRPQRPQRPARDGSPPGGAVPACGKENVAPAAQDALATPPAAAPAAWLAEAWGGDAVEKRRPAEAPADLRRQLEYPADDRGEAPGVRGLRRCRSAVALKVGADPRGGGVGVAGDARLISEDNAARARSIHEKHQVDTVGALLRGGPLQNTTTIALPRGARVDAAAGRFLYRARDVDSHFEIEAQLPGGRLMRVSRNALWQTVTFEGEVALGRWALGPSRGGARAALESERLLERLSVRVPAGLDLSGTPARVERNFAEGRCLVVFERRGAPTCRPSGDAERIQELDV